MSNDKIDDLEQKLEAFRQKEAAARPAGDREAKAGNMSTGMRAGTELVGCMLAGALLGWGVDKMFGTQPWGMIGLFLAGIFAGFWGVYRVTNNLGSSVGFASLQKGPKTATKPPENPDDEDD